MKVVFFDYWTGGIANFVPLHAHLTNLGHHTLLLHIGSFNDRSVPREEVIGGINCRDISYYNTCLIYEMLKKAKPDVVVTLNTTYILDRALVLACRSLGVRSVFVMHGVKNFGSQGMKEVIASLKSSYNGPRRQLPKLWKYIRVVMPNYIRSLWAYQYFDVLKLKPLFVLKSYAEDYACSMYFPKYSEEVLADKCLVYSESDRGYYKKLGYSDAAITVTGNVKFDSLLGKLEAGTLELSRLPATLHEMLKNLQPYALLLEEALPEQSEMGGVTAEFRNKYIMDLARRLKNEGLNLAVKLHPGTNKSTINVDVTLVNVFYDYLDELIYNAHFCISNFSTTINNSILLGKPVVTPLWGPLSNLPRFFIDHGVALAWKHIDESIEPKVDDVRVTEYINEYISVCNPIATQNVVNAIIC